MATDEHGLKPLSTNISKWANRNLWPLSSGEVAVRPGYNPLLSSGSGPFVGGGSVQNQRTGDCFHYLVSVDGGGRNPFISTYDENFTLLQSIPVGTASTPRDVSVIQVVGQVIVSSPDFPTYWGPVGSGLTRMLPGTSSIDGRSLVNPPRGLSVSWGDRCVIASDGLVYFSDPQAPRVFGPENITATPGGGSIYGLHVALSGALVVCTTVGVYALSVQAALGGYIVLGAWERITDFTTSRYRSTCQVRGELYGLTQRGYRRIDRELSQEVLLDEPRLGFLSADGSRLGATFPDYRRGAMVATESGPTVSIGYMLNRTDLESGLRSWWDTTSSGQYGTAICATLREPDGTELFLSPGGVFRIQGTSEFGSDGSLTVSGGYLGTPDWDPQYNPVIRWVDWATDALTATVSIDSLNATSSNVTQSRPVIGTDSWDTAGVVWAEANYQTKRFDFATRENSITLRLLATGACRRVDQTVNAWYKGPGLKRRQ